MSFVNVGLFTAIGGGAALTNINDKTPKAGSTTRKPMRMRSLLSASRIVQRFISQAIAKSSRGYIVSII